MPSKSSSGQRRAQGGGRTPNSEPKLQVFKEFNGVDFQHSNQIGPMYDPSMPTIDDKSQTDLQMNYVFIQNNASVGSNKTIESRNDVVTLFSSGDKGFTGPSCLVGPKLYVAMSDGSIGVLDIDSRSPLVHGEAPVIDDFLTLVNNTGSAHTWTSLDYYDDKLIALTEENEIWTADVTNYVAGTLSNAREVPNPSTAFAINGSTGDKINQKGSLVISQTMTTACPFRITLAHTYVNKYGPTRISPNTVFYANHPVSEWHAGCYLQINGTVPQGYGIRAIEMYYTSDNAMDMLFLGRTDIAPSATTWSYNWYGYVDATSMWPMANLAVPTENYTKGVHASRVKDIDGRLYFWGDSSNMQRLYIGGNPGNLLSVSPGTGGGFVDIEPGTGQVVRHVCKYKTQSGNSIITMLCSSPNTRKDQRYNLVENTISLSNEQSMKSWQAEQVAGAVGCKSFDGAVVCEDGLYSINRYGLALTTMTMEYNSQIRTNYVSDAIKPIFMDAIETEARLARSMLLELDGVIYMMFGAGSDQAGVLDNILFCYDIDLKAWWTYSLDYTDDIMNMFHLDWQGQREGIGLVTSDEIKFLPTTQNDDQTQPSNHEFSIETSKLSTQIPQQGWQYLSQLEFHFDHFRGWAMFTIHMVDMFGRELLVNKYVESHEPLYDYVVRMRIDQRVMSYSIEIHGMARFRLTHWIARVYTMSNKIGQVWGFDDMITQANRSEGSIHQTFECYNDVRDAIFT